MLTVIGEMVRLLAAATILGAVAALGMGLILVLGKGLQKLSAMAAPFRPAKD